MNKDDIDGLDWQWVEENPETALDLLRELKRENAALREAFAKAELLLDPAVAEGDYEYVEFCGYFRPNEIIVAVDRSAIDAARTKEAQP